MSTTLTLVLIAVFAGVCLSFWYAPAYQRYRGRRIVVCPQARERAVVEADALTFAATSLRDHPTLRLTDCTRWPEAAGCGQDCVAQLRRNGA